MAKSARSSRTKANHSKLRKSVYIPVEDERMKRLSEKLLAIAQEAKTVSPAQDDTAGKDQPEVTETTTSPPEKKFKPSKIQKSRPKKMTRSSVVFVSQRSRKAKLRSKS